MTEPRAVQARMGEWPKALQEPTLAWSRRRSLLPSVNSQLSDDTHGLVLVLVLTRCKRGIALVLVLALVAGPEESTESGECVDARSLTMCLHDVCTLMV